VETANNGMLHHKVVWYVGDLQGIAILTKSARWKEMYVNKILRKKYCMQKKKIRKNGTGMYTMRSEERVFVANEQLYSSAWSCRTGKRIGHP